MFGKAHNDQCWPAPRSRRNYQFLGSMCGSSNSRSDCVETSETLHELDSPIARLADIGKMDMNAKSIINEAVEQLITNIFIGDLQHALWSLFTTYCTLFSFWRSDALLSANQQLSQGFQQSHLWPSPHMSILLPFVRTKRIDPAQVLPGNSREIELATSCS